MHFGRDGPKALDFGGRLPTAVVVPGDESLALSTLGWQAVYRLLRAEPEIAVERFYLGGGRTPRSVESGRELSSFPVIALSVSFEEEYLRLLETLRGAGVPRRSAERPDLPLVLIGGPTAFLNPAPLARFADLFWVGEAEQGLAELLVSLKRHLFSGGDKQGFIHKVKDLPGVYAPGRTSAPARRAVLGHGRKLTEPAFSCFVSDRAAFKDSLLLEVNRGCPHGCRFCAAGYIYRPPRQAAMAELQGIVEAAQPPKVGLVGTALTDWPELIPFLSWLLDQKIKFSLSSLRADGLSSELLGLLRRSGVRTVTLALEAPSQRLRRMCSKKLSAETFLAALGMCAEQGVNHLRSYLIVGWPGETEADYDEFEDFLGRMVAARDRIKGPGKKGFMRLTISASCLVPKPWTPFQWAPMAGLKQLDRALARLKKMIRPLRGVQLSGDNPARARLQGLLARGDEKVADLLELAADLGGFKKALAAWEGDMSWYLDRERGENEAFAWEVLDLGVGREFLWREWQRAKMGAETPGCPAAGCGSCRACGLAKWLRTGAQKG
ncbi:MAG: radical SAM protein [Desulfovibrionaceae bacterium]|nr:radical SAM protein [Desulfovibrionaceae bacterium]